MTHHEIDVRAYGFEPSEEVVVAVGDAFEAHDRFIDPIVCGDVRSSALEISVEVEASTEAEARHMVETALGEALVRIGVVTGWTKVKGGEAVIA